MGKMSTYSCLVLEWSPTSTHSSICFANHYLSKLTGAQQPNHLYDSAAFHLQVTIMKKLVTLLFIVSAAAHAEQLDPKVEQTLQLMKQIALNNTPLHRQQ